MRFLNEFLQNFMRRCVEPKFATDLVGKTFTSSSNFAELSIRKKILGSV